MKTASIFSGEIGTFDTLNAHFYTNTTQQTRDDVAKMDTQKLNSIFKKLTTNNSIRGFLSKELGVPFSDKESDKFKDQQKRQFVAYLSDNSQKLSQQLAKEIDRYKTMNQELGDDLKYIQSIAS